MKYFEERITEKIADMKEEQEQARKYFQERITEKIADMEKEMKRRFDSLEYQLTNNQRRS